ncbi:MAG: APA family fibronectin-binding glycoprotein [Mycobacterium sp.]
MQLGDVLRQAVTDRRSAHLQTGQSHSAALVGSGQQRWFVVWVGSADNPVNYAAAKAPAEAIQPWCGLGSTRQWC